MSILAKKNFSEEERIQIENCIRKAELQASAEIRLFIEDHCKDNVLDRAAFIFEKLSIHKTALRNGVLFYLAFADRKFAILGDMGINARVHAGFWDEIKIVMESLFKENKFEEGLETGINMAGEALKKYFPRQSGDINELGDKIVFGKAE